MRRMFMCLMFSAFATLLVSHLAAQEEGPAAKAAPVPQEKAAPAAGASAGPPAAVIAPAAAEPVKIVGPGSREAWIPLLVRDKESESLAANGEGLCKRLDMVTRHFRYRLKEQTVTQLKPQDIAMAYLAVRKLGRIASELDLRQETIAFDFNAHINRHGLIVQKTADEFRKQPKFDRKKLMAELEAFLVKYNKSEKPAIEKLIDNKQYPQAHERITAAEEKLDPYLVWLDAAERARYGRTFYDLRQKFMAEWTAIRTKEFEAKRIAEREELAKTTLDLPDRIRAAGKSLATREKTDWQGASLNGLACLDAIREEWLEIQRLIAAGFAYDATLPGIGRKSKNLPATIPDVRKLNDAIASAIGEFIVSDTADCPVAEISEWHRKYMEKAASFTALSNREQTALALETSLDVVASKNPEYFAQVKAYREVTKDLIHWRKLATDAQAASLESDYPQLSSRVKTAFQQSYF